MSTEIQQRAANEDAEGFRFGEIGGKIKGIGVGEKWFGKNKMGKKKEKISGEVLGFLLGGGREPILGKERREKRRDFLSNFGISGGRGEPILGKN
ncbi:hypothetical protein V6Z11_A04G068000 [Gossypium hirsutum]